MTKDQKIVMVKAISGTVGCDKTDVISVYLDLAEAKILRRRYPYGTSGKALPSEYEILQVELAGRYLAKAGAEGEISHDENGVNRNFATVDDDDILSQVVPVVKVGG